VLYDKPVDVLIMIILGNEMVNITATAVMTALIISLFGDNWKFMAVLIMLPLILIFGEVVPKVIAIHYAERLARFYAFPFAIIYRTILPVILTFRKLTMFFTRVITGSKDSKKDGSEQDDLNVYLEVGEETGVLESSERHLLQNIFNLDKIEAWEIMRARREIFFISIDTPEEVILSEIRKKGYAKIPVVKDNLDDIKGVLHMKDLLQIRDESGIKNWQKVLRRPEYVFRTKKLSALLKDMRERNFTICFVVNEYGRIVGLLTMTDILRIIFKDIERLDSFPGWMSEQLEDGSYLISQSMKIELFNEFFNADLPVNTYRTMGRFLKSILGKNPQVGDSVEYDRWIFTIERSRDQSAKVIKVKEKVNG